MTSALINIDPDIPGGTPCIATTRLDVYSVAARVAAGETSASILTEAHVSAAVAYAAAHPFKEHPEGRPWRLAHGEKTAV